MPGCCSRPAACASFRNRCTISAARSCPSNSLRMIFSATCRSTPGSKPLYTIPMAPLPRVSRMWYLPIWWVGCTDESYPSGLASQNFDEARATVLDHVEGEVVVLGLLAVGVGDFLAVILVAIFEKQLDLRLAARGSDRLHM